MLEALRQSIESLTDTEAETDSLESAPETDFSESVPDAITAKGIDNTTERHVNEYEINYESSISKNMVVMDFSLTVTFNSIYSLFLFSALKGISESFSPIPLHILSAAINAVLGTALLTGKETNKKYVIGMIVSRIGITTAVNGVVLGNINESVKTSIETERKIIRQIDDFNGVQPEVPPPYSDIVAGILALIVAGGFGLKILLGNRNE